MSVLKSVKTRSSASRDRFNFLRHPAAAFAARDLSCYVATHHKTGTVWMHNLFRAIASRLAVPCLAPVPSPDPRFVLKLSGPHMASNAVLESTIQQASSGAFVLDRYRSFTEVPARIPGTRGIHLIRDPRDVLISATFYHLRSSEPWLHVAQPDFDGMTYQQALRSLPTLRDCLLFELKYHTGFVIDEMTTFPPLANVSTVYYESLMGEDSLSVFEHLFAHLGFPRSARKVALGCAERESIQLNPTRRRSAHIRSGATRQWRMHFDRALGEAFAEDFGAALVSLGYEPDESWLDSLPQASEKLDLSPGH